VQRGDRGDSTANRPEAGPAQTQEREARATAPRRDNCATTQQAEEREDPSRRQEKGGRDGEPKTWGPKRPHEASSCGERGGRRRRRGRRRRAGKGVGEGNAGRNPEGQPRRNAAARRRGGRDEEASKRRGKGKKGKGNKGKPRRLGEDE